MKLFRFGYAMFLGWLIHRQELDRKAFDAAKQAWETMQRRSAQIFMEERDRTLIEASGVVINPPLPPNDGLWPDEDITTPEDKLHGAS